MSPCENDLDLWLKNRDSERRIEDDILKTALSRTNGIIRILYKNVYFSRNQEVRKHPQDITLLSHSFCFFFPL